MSKEEKILAYKKKLESAKNKFNIISAMRYSKT
jgi:hypothetical protein